MNSYPIPVDEQTQIVINVYTDAPQSRVSLHPLLYLINLGLIGLLFLPGPLMEQVVKTQKNNTSTTTLISNPSPSKSTNQKPSFIHPLPNKSCHGGYTKPGRGFGWRTHPILKTRKFHYGLDLGCPQGELIVAAADGIVTAAAYLGSCGNGVKIQHSHGYETLYCHLSAIGTEPGRKVKQGEVIGRVGSTGRSTGPHLHYGLKINGNFVDPVQILP